MAITGSGTEQDPYIVETFAEFDSVRNISSTTYIEWSNAEIDFNDVQPYGYDDRFIMSGHITMTNIIWKNFTSRADCAISFGNGTGGNSSLYMECNNCKIIDTYQITSASEKYLFIGRGGNVVFNNCEISYRQDVGNATGRTGLLRDAAGDQTFNACAITIKSYGNKKNIWRLADGGTFEFCNINMDVQADKFDYPLQGFMCWYSGKIDIKTATSNSQSGGSGNIVWDVEITQPVTLTSSLYTLLSIYNSDKATITATNSNMLVGVTTEQLKNTSYLYSIGFPVR